MNYQIARKTFRLFVDDSHARFQERSNANKFSEILNKQDPAIKYVVEFEDHKHSLNFLDINITSNTICRKYKFKVHRKDANIHIKPSSYMFKKTYQGRNTVFSRHFVENEHQKTFLESLAKDYHSKKKSNDNRNYTNLKKIPWVHKMNQKLGENLKR